MTDFNTKQDCTIIEDNDQTKIECGKEGLPHIINVDQDYTNEVVHSLILENKALKERLDAQDKIIKDYINKIDKLRFRENLYYDTLRSKNEKTFSAPRIESRDINVERELNRIPSEPVSIVVPPLNRYNLVANPHYDKPVLTKDQAREMIAYIYTNLLAEEIPHNAFDILYTESRGIPNTLMIRLVDNLGEYVYGPNNYIGPYKTGYAEGKFEDILTNVPVLNEVDAKARLHDLATAISNQEEKISQDLPVEAQIASRIFSPLFHAGYSRRGEDRKTQIKLSGDVEENPGPAQTLIEQAEEAERMYNDLRWKACNIVGYDCDDLVDYSLTHMSVWDAYMFWTRLDNIMGENDFMDEDLVKTLLIRGGIEQNPGPPSNNEEKASAIRINTEDKAVTSLKYTSKASLGMKGARTMVAKTGVDAIKKNIYRFDKPGAEMDLILDIASNPTSANSFLTQAIGSDVIDLQAYLSDMYGSVPLRSASDDRTDIATPSSNNVMIAGYTTQGMSANGQTRPQGDRLFRYSLQNRHIREKLSSGDLGAGLDSATKVMTEFLAVGRTNTNAFAGDPMLELNSRIVAADYGDYINLAKLLAYTSLTEVAWGSATDRHLPDLLTRDDPLVNNIGVYFPGTLVGTAGASPVINAWWMNQQMLRDVIMGEEMLPNNMLWNDVNTCAIIPISRGYSLDAMHLITICHLEYPFFSAGQTNNSGFQMRMSATGTQPSIAAVTNLRFATENVLIDGPKYNVIFVTTDNSSDDLQISGGPAVFLNDINGVGTDIHGYLRDYVNNNMVTNAWAGYAEAMDYFLKFASSDDWVAAMIVAGNLIQGRVSYPSHMIAPGTAAQSMPIITATNNFSINNITTFQLNGGPGRSADWHDRIKLLPIYNSFGFPDTLNERPVATGVNPPRAIGITVGFFQDNTPLLRWGILTGCIRKNVLSGKDASSSYKSNRRPLFYAILKIYEIIADMAGYWYMEKRVYNQHMYYLGQQVTNRRIPLLKTLAEHTNNWQTMLCGVPFLRCGSTQLPIIVANLVGPVYADSGAWLSSPILLTNKMMYDNYFQVPFDCNMIYGHIYNKGWEGAYTPATLIYSILHGGAGSQCVPKAIMYKDQGGHGDIHAETLFALSRIKHYVDLNALISYLDVYLIDVAVKQIRISCPIMQFWSELMACASNNFTLGNWTTARPGLVTTIPYWPGEYDPITGIPLTVGITSVSMITAYQPGLSMTGLGSALLLNTDSYHAPGDSDLILSPGTDLF